jgi:Tfp pilus assembly protein PilZ
MQKILLYSEIGKGTSPVGDSIERQLAHRVFTANDLQALNNRLRDKVYNLLVIEIAEASDQTLAFIQELRNDSFTFPVLVVANRASFPIQEKFNNLPEVHLLMRPFHEKNLVGIVRKLLVSKKVPKQMFRRFATNQIAQVEALDSGSSLLTSMYNLSKGGAYCEFESEENITVGDFIRVKVSIPDTNNQYTFNAKVVWTTVKGRFSGRFGCGLRFVTAKDTYRAMMAKI